MKLKILRIIIYKLIYIRVLSILDGEKGMTMKTIYEAKELVDNAVESHPNGKTMNIFDFDGTIFNSPVPNPILWSSSTVSKLMNSYKENGLGWFNNTLTLAPEYIQGLTFNDYVVDAVKESMSNPDAITVLLTGRSEDFTQIVKDILDAKGLAFDEYGLKPNNTQETTMQFKQRFIKELLNKYDDVTRIDMWEDRSKHAIRFQEFIDSLGYEGEVHRVREPESHVLDANLERKLVKKLAEDPRAKGNIPSQFEGLKKGYYAAELTSDSHKELANAFRDIIPSDWTVVCHHMTMLFTKQRNETVEKFIEQNINRSVVLNATYIGISQDAIAVKIESDVPTNNDIPHVTVAIPPNGFARNSNNIEKWTKLDTPLKLNASIRHLFI